MKNKAAVNIFLIVNKYYKNIKTDEVLNLWKKTSDEQNY